MNEIYDDIMVHYQKHDYFWFTDLSLRRFPKRLKSGNKKVNSIIKFYSELLIRLFRYLNLCSLRIFTKLKK